MTESTEVTTSAAELFAAGRRHLAVGDYSNAAESLARACEVLAKEHGSTADQCAEAYYWYGKSLLGLSREESGVLGDVVPGNEEGNNEEEEENDDEENEENGDKENEENGDEAETAEPSEEPEKTEPESTTKDDEPASSKAAAESTDEPGPSNGDAHDESVVNLDNEDDVDNLQLAWEMLDLARSILTKRAEGGAESARALLADVHLTLGEVALESETYDKAVVDMQSGLDIQKEMYSSDNRRIAETHYQIGLANSLASNFDEAITHFKNAANILETRIKTLEDPGKASKDAAEAQSDKDEVKELKELLPEIQEKIQDMMDYKAETKRRLQETLCPSNGSAGFSSSNGISSSSSSAPKPAASDISHLIKRKRKSSESDGAASAPKRANT